MAFAEDGAIFEGYAAAGIEGIRPGTSNEIVTLPCGRAPVSGHRSRSPGHAARRRRKWSLLCSARRRLRHSPKPAIHGYPVLEHVHRLVTGEIIWAPAIAGALVLSTRAAISSCTLARMSPSAIPAMTKRWSAYVCRRRSRSSSPPLPRRAAVALVLWKRTGMTMPKSAVATSNCGCTVSRGLHALLLVLSQGGARRIHRVQILSALSRQSMSVCLAFGDDRNSLRRGQPAAGRAQNDLTIFRPKVAD